MIDNEEVRVISTYFDQNDGTMYTYLHWPDRQLCRTFRFFRDLYDSTHNGFVAESYQGSTMKFGMAFTWKLDSGEGSSLEWNSSDHLLIQRSASGEGQAIESYTFNSENQEFEYSLANPESVSQGTNFQYFFNTYIATSSLVENTEGELLGRTIGDAGFLNWLYEHYGFDELNTANWDWRRGVIDVGGTLKCLVGGGVANPLCHVYVGYTLATGVANLLCDLWVNCD